MSVILKTLSTYLGDDKHNEWDQFIPLVQHVYNSSPCLDSTEMTPFFLTHGRHPKSFVDLELEMPVDVQSTAVEYIGPLLERLKKDVLYL